MTTVVYLIATRFSEEFPCNLLFRLSLTIWLESAYHDNLHRLLSLCSGILWPRSRSKIVKGIRAVLIGLLIEKSLARLIVLLFIFIKGSMVCSRKEHSALNLDGSIIQANLSSMRLSLLWLKTGFLSLISVLRSSGCCRKLRECALNICSWKVGHWILKSMCTVWCLVI